MKQHSKEYTEYLKSEDWNERRQARLQKANYRCERCGERNRLDVHHKTYANLGNEPLSDLIALCQSCHWAADEERRGNKLPVTELQKPIPDKPISKSKMSKNQKRTSKIIDRMRQKQMRVIE